MINDVVFQNMRIENQIWKYNLNCVLIKIQLDLKMNSKDIDAIIITLINHDINMLIELDIPKEISSELNIVKNIVIEFNWL